MGWTNIFPKIKDRLSTAKDRYLGLLFHGRVDQLFVRRFAYSELDRAMEDNNRFNSEIAYTKWLRAEQTILYGSPLTIEQRTLIKQLSSEKGVQKADLVKLMYARAFTREGKVRFKKPAQFALAILVSFNAGLAFLWICLTSVDLVINSGASWPSISAAILIILTIPGLPAVYYAYCGIAPLTAYKRLSKHIA